MQQVFFHFPGSPRNSYEIPDAPEQLHPPQSVPVLPHAVLHYQLYVYSNPGLIIYPGICLIVCCAGFNLLGEGLRDAIGKEDEISAS